MIWLSVRHADFFAWESWYKSTIYNEMLDMFQCNVATQANFCMAMGPRQ